MVDILMIIIPILLIVGLIYYIKLRGSRSIATIEPKEAITSHRSYEDATYEDVINIIRSNFPAEQHTEVLDAINSKSNTYQLIILQYAEGNIDKVREYIKLSDKVGDYRDLVLALSRIKSK